MPLEKQSLNNFLPDGFETLNQEGYKTNFSEDKIKTGYEKDIKDRVSGPNLNNLIDVVGKNTNTLNNYVEYLNGMPINNVPTVNANGQLDYTNLDDKLTKKQITNCILEIPQRIKLELADGTLTLKAGSKVIVPNGFEDDGTTPKFDYVDIESDVSLDVNSNFVSSTVFIFFRRTNNTLIFCDPLTQAFSGTTQPTSTIVRYWLDTDTNLMKVTANSGETWSIGETSLPLCILNVDISNDTINSINQVFNGMGYIGSTVWVDKGVKVLMPDGRNADGTLKNIEFTTNKIHTYSRGITGNVTIYLTDTELLLIMTGSYDGNENFIYSTGEGFQYHKKSCEIGKCRLDNGVISNFSTSPAFMAVNYSDIDGRWVYSPYSLISTQTSFTTGQERKFDLSDYLPKDGNLYEVIVSASIVTGATNGNHINLLVTTDFINSATNICRAITRSNAIFYASGSITILVGAQKTLSFITSSGSSGTNYVDAASIKAYRKVR